MIKITKMLKITQMIKRRIKGENIPKKKNRARASRVSIILAFGIGLWSGGHVSGKKNQCPWSFNSKHLIKAIMIKD